jgi:hypothetical protein
MGVVMGKVFGILVIVVMIWVGLEFYLEGPSRAFGGVFATYLGAEPAEEGAPSLTTPQRAGASVERAHRQTDERYGRMLGE